jgi:isoleucyl-tRNA synthetase
MDYKDTLNLPQTDFAMKANLNQREPEMLAKWEQNGLYSKLEENGANKPLYILHDGPPYANGHIHIGHALNKTLKDIVLKVKRMQGFHAPYVPGWDCHGLPIELQVEKNLGSKKHQMSKLPYLCRQVCGYPERGIQTPWYSG